MKYCSVTTILLLYIYFSAFIITGNATNSTQEKLISKFKEISQKIVVNYLKSKPNLTGCPRDIFHTIMSLARKEQWTYKMLDSWGKLPNGVLTFSGYDFGQYDECVELETERIKGKYCLGEFSLNVGKNGTIVDFPGISGFHELDIDFTSKKANKANNSLVFMNGICLPRSCDAEDMEDFLKIVIDTANFTLNVSVSEENCSSNETPEWKTLDWIAFALYTFFGVLILLSTSYDFMAKYLKKKVDNDRLHDLLISFSIWTNTLKLTSSDDDPEYLRSINGLKSISLIWIMIFHRYLLNFSYPLSNMKDLKEIARMPENSIIFGGHLAYDSFFVLSGLLVSYTCFKNKIEKRFNVFIFLSHRIIKFTPALAAVILFYMTFFKRLGDGPMWNKTIDTMVSKCDENWWKTLAYIQNYMSTDMCIPQSWYISCDMHLYLLSPILIYPFMRKKLIGLVNAIFWIIALQITLFVFAYQNEWNAGIIAMNGLSGYNDNYYYMTHTRAVPWLLGFVLGYFLCEKSGNKIKINMLISAILWTVSISIMSALIYAMAPLQDVDRIINQTESIIYIAFARNIWALCLLWIITACTFGYGGLVNWFLSLKMWNIFGKLNYSMFLVHVMIQLIMVGTMREPLYITTFTSISDAISDIIFTVFVAYLITVSFELPFVAIKTMIFSKRNTLKISEK